MFDEEDRLWAWVEEELERLEKWMRSARENAKKRSPRALFEVSHLRTCLDTVKKTTAAANKLTQDRLEKMNLDACEKAKEKAQSEV